MTAIAFNLLGLALQLLIAAQQPNVPTEVRIQAVQTATYAIEYAQASMPEDKPKEGHDYSAPKEAPYGESYDSSLKDLGLDKKADKDGYGTK